MPKLFSYVVEHDRGHAPNPYFGACTLCRCKYRKAFGKPRNVVELAKEGDWVIGTGGKNLKRSAGRGRIVYAMRVDQKLTRAQYFRDPRFARKKPATNGNYAQCRGDNQHPITAFEKAKQFAPISWHFYYFGRDAVFIPKNRFPNLEKKGPGFRADFDAAYISRFAEWLETETGFKPGIHGEPCMKSDQTTRNRKETGQCRSSC